MRKLCECGCGQVVKAGNRFIVGHNLKCLSKETRKRLAKNLKGGMTGKHHTEETKRKLSKILQGKQCGEDNPFYGMYHTEETRKIMSKLKKESYIGKGNPFYGRHHTKKTKRKLREGKLGRKLTEEHKRKINPKGRKHSKETKDKMSKSRITYMGEHNLYRDTSIEIAIKEQLEKLGINFVQQKYIEDVGLVDFFLPDYDIIIECDGDYWHNLEGAQKKDVTRDFASTFFHRYKTLRFWEHEINGNIDECIRKIKKELITC